MKKTLIFSSLALFVLFVAVVGYIFFEEYSKQKAIQETLKAAYKHYESGEYQTCYETTLPLAEKGNQRAQYLVGLIDSEGLRGQINIDKAIYWFEKSGKQGFAASQLMLGLIFYSEQKNYTKAADWFEKAASQDCGSDCTQAQYFLGIIYEKGNGRPQDYDRAIQLYTKAADAGNKTAIQRINKLKQNQKDKK